MSREPTQIEIDRETRAIRREFRGVIAEVFVTMCKIAAALVVLYVLGTLAGCGGSVEGEPEEDNQQPTMTVQPVQCAAQGCAK